MNLIKPLRVVDWLVLVACLGLASHWARAETPASTGTHDAQTWFTDTLVRDQDGQQMRFYSDLLKDKVVLLNVVFTHCSDACPLITRKLKDVRQALGDKAGEVTFITLTSDPANDDPAALKAFARQQGVDGPHWRFITADPAAMTQVLARLGHQIPAPAQHSTLLIAGDVAGKRWSKIRPDASPQDIAARLQLLAEPVAGR